MVNLGLESCSNLLKSKFITSKIAKMTFYDHLNFESFWSLVNSHFVFAENRLVKKMIWRIFFSSRITKMKFGVSLTKVRIMMLSLLLKIIPMHYNCQSQLLESWLIPQRRNTYCEKKNPFLPQSWPNQQSAHVKMESVILFQFWF